LPEYRLWITVPNLAIADEAHWEPLITWLERNHGDSLDPVIGWSDDVAQIVVSTPAESEAHASEIALEAVTAALGATRLDDRRPSVVELERVVKPVAPGDRLPLDEVRDGAVLSIVPGGDLDLANADVLDRALIAAGESDAERIVLDLRRLDFIDSTGLLVILAAAARLGERLGVYRGKGDPAQMLRLTETDVALNLLD
jgi:anti-anti-sigma factor